MSSKISNMDSIFLKIDQDYQDSGDFKNLKVTIKSGDSLASIIQIGNIELDEALADVFVDKLIIHYKDQTKLLEVFQNLFQNCLEEKKDFRNTSLEAHLSHYSLLLKTHVICSKIKERIAQFETIENQSPEDLNQVREIKNTVEALEKNCGEKTTNFVQMSKNIDLLLKKWIDSNKLLLFSVSNDQKSLLAKEILTNSIQLKLYDWSGLPTLRQDKFGMNDLHYAAWIGDVNDFQLIEEKIGERLNEFINQSATIDLLDATPLDLAVRTKNYSAVRWLLSHGANINKRNRYGETPFMKAIKENDLDAVRLCIYNRELDLYEKDVYGRNPIHLAACLDEKQILEFLLSKDELKSLKNMTDIFGQTPLDLAIENKKDETIALLLETDHLDVHQLSNYGRNKADISQGVILEQWEKYINITDQDQTIFKNLLGMCFGFTFMGQYFIDLGKEDEFYQILELFSRWDGSAVALEDSVSVENLSGNYRSLKDLMDQWINNVSWMNHTDFESITSIKQSWIKEIYDVVKTSDSKDLNLMLSFGTEFYEKRMNLDQLTEMLNFFSMIPNSSVTIVGNQHATGLRVLSNGFFQYYDSNLPHKIKIYDSSKELAKVIMDTKYLQLGSFEESMNIGLIWYQFLSKEETLKPLIDNNSLEIYSPNGFSALHRAIILRDKEKIHILLNEFEEINTKDEFDNTPLDWAILMNQNEVVSSLLSHPKLDFDFNAQVKIALEYNNIEALRMLVLRAKNSDDDLKRNLTQLLNFYLQNIFLNNTSLNPVGKEIVELLISEGADIYSGYPSNLSYIARLKDLIFWEKILDFIPDINKYDESGRNLYHHAFQFNNDALIEFLVKKNIDINMPIKVPEYLGF